MTPRGMPPPGFPHEMMLPPDGMMPPFDMSKYMPLLKNGIDTRLSVFYCMQHQTLYATPHMLNKNAIRMLQKQDLRLFDIVTIVLVGRFRFHFD